MTPERIAAFKAKASTLETPALRVLWGQLQADPETSLAALLWVGGEIGRREKREG